MIFGKWLGGELKKINDNKTKQLVIIKIQNILFEAQYGEPAFANSRIGQQHGNNPVMSNGPNQMVTNTQSVWPVQNTLAYGENIPSYTDL